MTVTFLQWIIGRAGASPPSRTTGLRCLYNYYIYIYICIYVLILCIYPVHVPDTVNF